MTEPLATLRGVSVSYAREGGRAFALREVDLAIAKGERLAIIGESGSGKSTLALALAGLLPPEAAVSGQIDWPGFAEGPRAGRDIGMVFQDPGSSLNPVLTIGELVSEGAVRHLRLGRAEARQRALDLLARVRIPQPEAALDAYPHQFSGGQRQRIAIACAIAASPKVLIADEATSALDMIVQAEITALLDMLVREDGMSLIFITHDIALAAKLADSIAVFRDAMLVEAGPARQVLGRPVQDYTRSLIATHIDFSSPRLIGEPA
ncbi:ABC transporter ATP-binding protein [Nitratireductor pacificus]|uniref:Putative ATP-binding component of ABC transporter n=1 Tax=Nitratireductor pacificus pht-3B TaxID=391937 RepID=K2MM12_9HYPH|nr:ABC transporter ATP-binding protein [Nitratireductor pacificus]EKF18267.1 putative ATP-binding component of ABC transporter [Nitratireductor pacificus pht-3B]